MKDFKNSLMLTIFRAIQELESRMEQHKGALKLARGIQFLTLNYLITRLNIINPLTNSTGVLTGAFGIIERAFELPTELLLISICGVSFLFLFLGFLSQTGLNQSRKEMVVWPCVIIALVIRIVNVIIIDSILKAFSGNPDLYPLLGRWRFLLLAPILLVEVYLLIVNKRNHIYGILHPVIYALSLLETTNAVLFALMLLVLAYKIVYAPLGDDLAYIIVGAILVVFQFSQTFTSTIHYSQVVVYAIVLIVCTGNIFWKWSRLNLLPETGMDLDWYHDYIESKKESPLKTQEQFLIQQGVIQLFQKCSDTDLQRTRAFVVQTSVSQWSYSQHIELLLTQNQVYLALKQSKEAQTRLLSHKLWAGKTLEALLEVSNMFSRLSVTGRYKYSLFRLLAKLERYFRRQKKDMMYIESTLEIDRDLELFYGQLGSLFNIFIEIWDYIKKDIVDFSVIQPLYSQAISKYSQSETILASLSERTMSKLEINRFRELSRVLQLRPFHQSTMASTEHAGHNQGQIPFIRISQGKITHCSYRFKDRFNYFDQDLVGTSLSNLLPLSFRQDLASFQTNDTNISLQLKEKHSVIRNGRGCMQFVRISPYLEPNFGNQITYLLFVTALNDSRASCMIYSLDNDTIQEMSAGFLRQFSVSKDMHHGVSGKETFQNFNFSAPKNRLLLESRQSVETTILIFKLKGNIVDRHTRVTVNLKLLHQFNHSGSVRLLVQVKSLNYDYINKIAPYMSLMVQKFIPGSSQGSQLTDSEKVYKSELANQPEDQYVLQLLDKKQGLNRQKVGETTIVRKRMYFLRLIVNVVSLVVVWTLLFKSCRWYQYNVLQINFTYEKVQDLSDLLLGTYTLTHLKSWPPQQLQSSQITFLVKQGYRNLKIVLRRLYTDMVSSSQEFNLGNNENQSTITYSTKGIRQKLFDAILACYLIFTYDFSQKSLDSFQTLELLEESTQTIVMSSGPLNTWVNVIVFLCAAALATLIVIRVAQTYHDYVSNKILLDTQNLFSYISNKQANIRISLIESTVAEQGKTTHSMTMGQKHSKSTKNIVNRDNCQGSRKSICNSTHFTTVSVLKSLVIIISLMVLFGYTIGFALQLKREVPALLTYQNNMQQAYTWTKNRLVHAYYNLIQRKLGNGNIGSQPSLDFVKIVVQGQDCLPPAFDGFRQNLWNMLNADMCVRASKLQRSRCINSVLRSGVSKSMDAYMHNVTRLNQMNIDDLYSNLRLNNVVFTQKLMTLQMDRIVDEYMKYSKFYYDWNVFRLFVVIVATLLTCTVAFAGTISTDKTSYNSKSWICKSLFNLFPEQIFYRADVRTYLQDTSLIERLSDL